VSSFFSPDQAEDEVLRSGQLSTLTVDPWPSARRSTFQKLRAAEEATQAVENKSAFAILSGSTIRHHQTRLISVRIDCNQPPVNDNFYIADCVCGQAR
jgi:hypothetical protein